MFFGWYRPELSGQVAEIEFSGIGGNPWQALEGVALILTLTVVVAVGAAVLRLAGSGWRPAVPLNAATAVLGGFSALLILLRILSPPELAVLGGVVIEAIPRLPIFLALAAAFGVAYGGYRAMHEEGSSFAAVADSLRVDPRQREGRRREGTDAGRTSKRTH